MFHAELLVNTAFIAGYILQTEQHYEVRRQLRVSLERYNDLRQLR